MSCPSGKVQYTERALAKRAARRDRARGKGHRNTSGKRLRPYRCVMCGCWHLTSRVSVLLRGAD